MSRPRPSMLLLLMAVAVAASGVAALLGAHMATGSWALAAMIGLSVWLAAGALGIGLVRVNDRLGQGADLQRRSTAAIVSAVTSVSSAHDTASPTVCTSPAPDPSPASAEPHPSAEAPRPVEPPEPAERPVPVASLKPAAPSTPPKPPSDARARLGQLLALPKTEVPMEVGGRQLAARSREGGREPLGIDSRPASAVRVAMIADEFTYRSFEPEWTTTRLHPSGWREAMEEAQPEVFFCESAWAGGTPPDRPWQGKIYDSVRWAGESRAALIDIITHCRRKGIPTIFWNKEDPIHFGDRIHDFVATANLFDAVFTTAEECVEGYLRDTDVKHVGVLPFAVQPRIFNPFGVAERSDSAVFAGSWYPNYSDRAQAAETILDLVLASGRGLEIYDRMYDAPERHRFPAKYDGYRLPSIPYGATADAYRRHAFSITLNTITDSTTMFARRIYEAAACGSVVLSNTSVGVEAVFGDAVILADRDPERLLELTGDQYASMQRRSIDIAMQNTYAHRAHTVLQMAGVEHGEVEAPSILAVGVSSPEMACAAAETATELGFDHLLCLVDASAVSLTQLRDSIGHLQNATMIDDAAIGQAALPVVHGRSSSVFYGQLGDLPSKAWLARARPLLPYSHAPLVPSSGGVGSDRTPAGGPFGTLMTQADFVTFVGAGQPLSSLHAV